MRPHRKIQRNSIIGFTNHNQSQGVAEIAPNRADGLIRRKKASDVIYKEYSDQGLYISYRSINHGYAL